MRTVARLSSILIAVLSSGCMTTTSGVNSTVLMPEAFQAKNKQIQQNNTSDIRLSHWWTAFGDQQLTNLVSIARKQNLTLAQTSARVMQARAGVRLANAALVPSGAISANAARSYQSKETPIGQILAPSNNFDRFGSSYDASLGVSWEIDLFGGLRSGRNAAVADYQAAEASNVAASLVVTSQVVDVYITIRGIQSRLAIIREQIKNQQEILSLSKLLQSKGLITNQTIHQIEANLAQTQAALPSLEQGLAIALNAMDVMLGQAIGTSKQALKQASSIPSANMEGEIGTPNDLLRRRPDLIAAERRLAAASERVDVAVSEYYPKFSLASLIGTATAISNANMFTNNAAQASGILGIRWRLFDFGRIEAQIALSKGEEAELLAAYRFAALKATEDVENSLTSVAKSNEQVSLLGQGLESLIQAKNSSVVAFNKGVNSRIDVLLIENEVLRATDTQIQAQVQSAHATVTLFKSLGGGWEPHETAMVANK